MSSFTRPTPASRRSLPWRRWLFLALFIGLPLLEIWAILAVGRLIGPWWTIALLIIDSMIGWWLLRREGRVTWAAFQRALNSGRLPDSEIADGGLVIVGGTLLLTPGFVTDLVGILLLLPVTRRFARVVLARIVRARMTLVASTAAGGRWSPGTGGASSRTAPRPGAGPTIPGEVIHPDA